MISLFITQHKTAYAEQEDIITRNRVVSILNNNVIEKKEVINYWLSRMFIEYNTSRLSSYIVSEPSAEDIVKSANIIVDTLKAYGKTEEEIIKVLLANKYDFVTYKVSTGVTYSFYIKLDSESVLKSIYPSIKILDSINTDGFYASNERLQSNVYKGLNNGVGYLPDKVISPIKNIIPEEITTSRFGNREDLFFGGSNLNKHTGTDLAMPGGTEIIAVEDGVIKTSKNLDWGYGKHLIIDHDGYFTLYAHCSEVLVTEGQLVDKGEVIAKVGSTGWSTGNHLHFEMIVNGEPIDALKYIRQGE